MKKTTQETAQEFIDFIEQKYREIDLLEQELKTKKNEIAKTMAKLRCYKKRNIVTKISKYRYIVNK